MNIFDTAIDNRWINEGGEACALQSGTRSAGCSAQAGPRGPGMDINAQERNRSN